MPEQEIPPTPSQPNPSESTTKKHTIQLVKVDPVEEATLLEYARAQLPDEKRPIKPLAAPIDQFLNSYPEARQIRPTIPCPLCKVEIPIPHGSLRGYVEYLQANDPTSAEGIYTIRMHSPCQRGRKCDISPCVRFTAFDRGVGT